MNKDFAKGMIVSMALKALPVRKKSPIAYLYNGVRLPALPEWDRERYPYAVISVNPSGVYELKIDSDPIGVAADGTTGAPFADFKYRCIDGEWQSSSATAFNFVPIWGNKDIYWAAGDKEGELFLAASTPIPIYNEPVNYLYNGVKLPKLPEWDKTVYPYATIWSPAVFGYLSEDYGLVVTSAPLHVVEGTGSISLKSTGEVVYRSCSYDKETETWKQLSDETTETYSKSGGVRWANYDILKANGNLYLEASEPIPIYE